MKSLFKIIVQEFTTEEGLYFKEFPLTYEIFGDPVNLVDKGVLAIHALTGNSNVCGDEGWWQDTIGPNKTIDLNEYSVICFNIPGNGYDSEDITVNIDEMLTSRDIAALFIRGLQALNIYRLWGIIGASLGGLITWEIAIQKPELAKYILPIAAGPITSDWVRAHTAIQEEIFLHSDEPQKISRMLAMMFYRTPKSFEQRFKGAWNEVKNQTEIESYLHYQGDKLTKRMSHDAYRRMNYLLGSQIHRASLPKIEKRLKTVKSKIVMTIISSDILFSPDDLKITWQKLKTIGVDADLHEIISDFGHDAFLVEWQQLDKILNPYFPVGQNKNIIDLGRNPQEKTAELSATKQPENRLKPIQEVDPTITRGER